MLLTAASSLASYPRAAPPRGHPRKLISFTIPPCHSLAQLCTSAGRRCAAPFGRCSGAFSEPTLLSVDNLPLRTNNAYVNLAPSDKVRFTALISTDCALPQP